MTWTILLRFNFFVFSTLSSLSEYDIIEKQDFQKTNPKPMNKKPIFIAAILLLAILAVWLLYEKETEIEESLILPDNLSAEQDNLDGQDNLISPSENIQSTVSSYLRNNISSLSYEKPVLGGSWYTTKIEFLQGNKGRVYYEDGHIAREASFSYVIDGDNVAIFNFYIIPEEVAEPITDDVLEDNISSELLPTPEEMPAVGGAAPSSGQAEVEPVFCTMDAMMCPDGSYVGRTAPNCEFAPCPSVN